jgi:hypothetical protein
MYGDAVQPQDVLSIPPRRDLNIGLALDRPRHFDSTLLADDLIVREVGAQLIGDIYSQSSWQENQRISARSPRARWCLGCGRNFMLINIASAFRFVGLANVARKQLHAVASLFLQELDRLDSVLPQPPV